ncbi:MAG: agarase [Bacteroidota bacterium]
MTYYRRSLPTLFLFLGLLPFLAFGQVTVDLNFDMKHRVGDQDSLDREKFITLHAGVTDGDYGDQLDKLSLLINDFDAYFGRETGRMRFMATRVAEDPNRPGFTTEAEVQRAGTSLNNNYANSTARHALEKGRQITAAQTTPFYPNGVTPVNPGDPADEQWFFSSTDTPEEPFGSAVGQYMGQFVKHGYGEGGTSGPPRPHFVEVMNEPVWPLVDMNFYGGGTIDDIFKLHLTVADSVRAYAPESVVGGYCTAFPDFEKPGMNPGNDEMFGQWEERWQRFVDEVGPEMDFYSLHFYDFPSISGGLEQNRKGSNMEATMDMLEHYSTLQYGEIKPLVISEYGSQLNDFFQEKWSPGRDWYIIKAFNAMMMQFMERPDVIEKTIPFVLAKADFFFGDRGPDLPYPWRMLRRANEPASYTGDWVFTEVVKFYELWANVKGARVETRATDPDLYVDAYVDEDENKAYVILHNIDEEDHVVNLAPFGLAGTPIAEVNTKYLFLSTGTDAPVLRTTTSAELPESVTVAVEATMIMEITFAEAVAVDEVATEEKIYATTYKQPIFANQAIDFTIPGITVGKDGEAVLRLGIGRPLAASRVPSVSVNGTAVTVTEDYRGDDQRDRAVFFGVLEIPVPYDLLQAGDNEIAVTFPDAGGFVSSVALQKFDFTRNVIRTVAEDRDRTITFTNREDFVPDGASLPTFTVEQNFTANLAYATGVVDSVEEDLNYIAMQLRQVDENFEIVNTSAFQAVVATDAPNSGEVAIDYTLPTQFADGMDIPVTANLPAGHKLLLLLFMSVDNDAGFANANTEIILNQRPDRDRAITFVNKDAFIPADSLLPRFDPGQNFTAELDYSTGVSNGIEEDLADC